MLRFLLKRGYDIALIAASGLVVPKEHSSGFYDRFRGRVIIPLRNERGEIISFSGRALGKIEPKYINGPETLVFKKERFLYNLDLARSEIKRKKEAILVEGYFDAISPYQEETKNVVASSGTSLTTGQLSLIKKYSETLVIFYDTDTAGIEATKRALSLAQEIKLDVKVGILPDNIKDPDEAIQKDKKILKRASDFLLPIIADIKHDIQKAHYIKKLSSVIDISEDAIVQALLKIANTNHLNDKISRTSPATDSGSKLSSEEYIIALILKVPNDLAQKTLYKLSNEDFYYDETKNLFVKLKEYMLEKERFLIKNFYLKLTDDERKLAEKLYLMEISLADNENIDQEVLEKEIKKIFDIINKETIRRKLKSLSGLIKNAEQEDNTDQLSRLQYEFSLLSKKVKSS
ncbi:MAG: primase protein [Candidatus Collierbacteria bacterium GW2011_GWA1_44_12]|uniref:Primase protein n=1 Tax=Candidatus Collierbacteria bacterium GW2011_GWA1_44_12 TaxID=1618376 RepID=A0A0G1IVD0_9BACT|nr:MAG: primase protein [Candidatus Collierbacteria bacterium GW2011_GWA1_44_12]